MFKTILAFFLMDRFIFTPKDQDPNLAPYVHLYILSSQQDCMGQPIAYVTSLMNSIDTNAKLSERAEQIKHYLQQTTPSTVQYTFKLVPSYNQVPTPDRKLTIHQNLDQFANMINRYNNYT